MRSPFSRSRAIASRADTLPARVALPQVAGWTQVPPSKRAEWQPNYPGADHFVMGRYADGMGAEVDLALAVYGLGILTVNWFGVIFLVLAFALFILDIKTPTHGALTAAGIGSFILGALVLFNSPGVPEFQRVSVPLVVFVALLMGLSFAVIIGFALRAQKTPLSMGRQTLIGAVGLAKGNIDPRGQVQLNSELWSAELAEGVKPLQSGDKVVVVGVEGLRLKVRKSSKQAD